MAKVVEQRSSDTRLEVKVLEVVVVGEGKKES